MKRPKIKINEALTVAFIKWLAMIGYRHTSRADGLHFSHAKHDAKWFPRNVIVFNDGKLNKVANQLFAEFYRYVEVQE